MAKPQGGRPPRGASIKPRPPCPDTARANAAKHECAAVRPRHSLSGSCRLRPAAAGNAQKRRKGWGWLVLNNSVSGLGSRVSRLFFVDSAAFSLCLRTGEARPNKQSTGFTEWSLVGDALCALIDALGPSFDVDALGAARPSRGGPISWRTQPQQQTHAVTQPLLITLAAQRHAFRHVGSGIEMATHIFGWSDPGKGVGVAGTAAHHTRISRLRRAAIYLAFGLSPAFGGVLGNERRGGPTAGSGCDAGVMLALCATGHGRNPSSTRKNRVSLGRRTYGDTVEQTGGGRRGRSRLGQQRLQQHGDESSTQRVLSTPLGREGADEGQWMSEYQNIRRIRLKASPSWRLGNIEGQSSG